MAVKTLRLAGAMKATRKQSRAAQGVREFDTNTLLVYPTTAAEWDKKVGERVGEIIQSEMVYNVFNYTKDRDIAIPRTHPIIMAWNRRKSGAFQTLSEEMRGRSGRL